MKIHRNIFAAALLSASLFTSTVPVQAGGLLADIFIKPICKECAKKADKWHAKQGKPLDALARAILLQKAKEKWGSGGGRSRGRNLHMR